MYHLKAATANMSCITHISSIQIYLRHGTWFTTLGTQVCYISYEVVKPNLQHRSNFALSSASSCFGLCIIFRTAIQNTYLQTRGRVLNQMKLVLLNMLFSHTKYNRRKWTLGRGNSCIHISIHSLYPEPYFFYQNNLDHKSEIKVIDWGQLRRNMQK